MSNDLSCKDTETGDLKDTVKLCVDLTIILDITWPFNEIQAILT